MRRLDHRSVRTPAVEYARTSDGVAIAYGRVGHGPPLLILPTVPFSNFVAEWDVSSTRRAYEALAARMQLVQYDGRGTGHSQRDVTDVSPDAMIRDLEAVVGRLGVPSVNLLALYNASPIALRFAAENGTRVTRIALFGGWSRGWTAMSSPRTQALLSLIDQDWGLFSETAVREWFGWHRNQSMAAAAAAIRGAVAPTVARSILRGLSGFDVTSILSRVASPTLVLHRRHLAQVPLEVSVRLAEELPAGRVAVLDGASAALFDEDGERAAALLSDFFVDGSLPPRASEAASGRLGSDAAQRLTTREREILRLVAAGLSNAEVAAALSVAVSTVERHLGSIYRKLELRGRADAVAFAIRSGIS